MAGPLLRRDFIKDLSLAGASIMITDAVAANTTSIDEVKNEWLRVSFDRHKGTLNVYRNNENVLSRGGTVCINTETEKLSIASDRYNHT